MHHICAPFSLLVTLFNIASKALNQINSSKYDFLPQGPCVSLGNTLKCMFQDIKFCITPTKLLQSSKLMSNINRNLLASIEF